MRARYDTTFSIAAARICEVQRHGSEDPPLQLAGLKPGTYNYGGHYNDSYSGQGGGLRVWKSNARVAATREARQMTRAVSY